MYSSSTVRLTALLQGKDDAIGGACARNGAPSERYTLVLRIYVNGISNVVSSILKSISLFRVTLNGGSQAPQEALLQK